MCNSRECPSKKGVYSYVTSKAFYQKKKKTHQSCQYWKVFGFHLLISHFEEMNKRDNRRKTIAVWHSKRIELGDGLGYMIRDLILYVCANSVHNKLCRWVLFIYINKIWIQIIHRHTLYYAGFSCAGLLTQAHLGLGLWVSYAGGVYL